MTRKMRKLFIPTRYKHFFLAALEQFPRNTRPTYTVIRKSVFGLLTFCRCNSFKPNFNALNPYIPCTRDTHRSIYITKRYFFPFAFSPAARQRNCIIDNVVRSNIQSRLDETSKQKVNLKLQRECETSAASFVNVDSRLTLMQRYIRFQDCWFGEAATSLTSHVRI